MRRRIILTIRFVIITLSAACLGLWFIPGFWLLWLSLIPLALFMPVFATAVACANCTGTGNNASQTVQADLSGFGNKVCTNCAAYNSSFVMTFTSESFGVCFWNLTLSSTCLALTDKGDGTCINFDGSTANSLQLELHGAAPFTQLLSLWNATTSHTYVHWQSTPGSAQNCTSTSSYTLPWLDEENCFVFDPGDHNVSCTTTHASAVITFL